MNFPWYLAKKISFSKDNKKNLSQIIIRIGQIGVIIGTIISLLTIGMGYGAKKSIKSKLLDFNGHLVVKNFDTNNSYNSSALKTDKINFTALKNHPQVAHIQKFATKSGIIRTDKGFEGVLMKGYGSDYDTEQFKQFLKEGTTPVYSEDTPSNQVLISEKIAKNLHLKLNDSFVMYFLSETGKPIYRKLTIQGIFKTDIKNIDDNYIIGDLNHVQHLNKWKNEEVGGYEIYLKEIEDMDKITPELSKIVGFESNLEKSTDTYVQIISWINLFDTNIYVILGIMMVVVVINLIMVLLILIIERTPFIGIMKTLGSSNGQIQLIFVYYTLLIMLPGLVIGSLISLGILYGQKYFKLIRLNPDNYFFEAVPVYIDPWYFFGFSFLLLLISFLVLLIPSFIVWFISPSKVLKFD